LRPVIKFSVAIIAILVLVVTEALAMWGVMITLSRVRSGWLMAMGFWVGYVKRRVGYLAVPKGLVERDVVDDLTS
jgi:hypothetical protein